MRLAHLAALAATLAPAAWAQATSGDAARPPAAQARPTHSADSAQAPTAPLRHLPLPASGAMADDADDWKAANAAVAEFPGGHADIVRWEAARPSTVAPALPHGSAHGPHGRHGSQP